MQGKEELGAIQRREAQPGQGRSKGMASPARHGSAVGNRHPRGAHELAGAGYGMGANRRQQARSVAGRARWGSRLGVACRGRHRRPGGRRPLPLDGTKQGRGEKREKGQDSN
jgi:hypothetical protein